LKGQDLQGVTGLWGYAGEECYLSNLRLNPGGAGIKNGTGSSGVWDVTFAGDNRWALTGSLKLGRDGPKLTGVLATISWQPERGVMGVLSFAGKWPQRCVPGAVSARRQMAVEGRTDGP